MVKLETKLENRENVQIDFQLNSLLTKERSWSFLI